MVKMSSCDLKKDKKNTELGKRIKIAVLYSGKTQIKIAELLGIKSQNLSRWITGNVAPGWYALVLISEICEAPLEWLLTGEGDISEDFKNREDDKIIKRISEIIKSMPENKKIEILNCVEEKHLLYELLEARKKEKTV